MTIRWPDMAAEAPEPDLLGVLPHWLAPLLEQLLGQREALHHGLMLAGPAGIGKSILGRHLAAGLLCETDLPSRPGGQACLQCQSCQWMQQLAHPDLRLIMPEALDPLFVGSGSKKPSREIKIDQVRMLSAFMAVGAHRAGWRIVIVDPAEAMNPITANGLLKTLEEPGARTLLILPVSHADRLPATVRSRCRVVPVNNPPTEAAAQWLVEHGAESLDTARRVLRAAGSPMHALQFIEPAEQAAHQSILEALGALPDTAGMKAVDLLDRHDPMQWSGVLQRWISDLTRVVAGASAHYYPQAQARMQQLAPRTSLAKLTTLQVSVSTLSARIDHPLNARLLCESTILDYCQTFAAERSERR
ncbi:MAG: DNA polymerase III subunit delta' [Burkholderiaceae bacterium]